MILDTKILNLLVLPFLLGIVDHLISIFVVSCSVGMDRCRPWRISTSTVGITPEISLEKLKIILEAWNVQALVIINN
jgi:hypothetical protein